MIGKYEVNIEELDNDGNVWDSTAVKHTDDYDEALSFAKGLKVTHRLQQIAIWTWDDQELNVIDSEIVKTYDK